MSDADREQLDRDPIEQAQERARGGSEGSGQPSDRGMGPGAGNAPDATMTAPPASGDDLPAANTSMGAPTRHDDDRPDYRSGQLDHGSESGQRGGPDEKPDGTAG